MSETEGTFKAIESQDELNAIIRDRLKRERETTEKRYEGWISPDDHQKALEEAGKTLDEYKKAREDDAKTIEDLKAKNQAYETASLKSRIAHEVGLSHEWISRIGGTDEESIRADAESLKKLVGEAETPIPTKSTETDKPVDSSTAALKQVLGVIKSKD